MGFNHQCCLSDEREAAMPGDPNECRRRALRCADLAHTAKSPELKSTLIDLSENWMRIALDLEHTYALMLMENPEPVMSHHKH